MGERAGTPATRPGPARRRAVTRIVLAWGVLTGLLAAWYLLLVREDAVGIDAEVYYYAARAALDGGAIYAATPPDWPAYTYMYPPGTLLAFLPLALADTWWPTYWALLAANLAAATATGLLLARYAERGGASLSGLDRALLVGVLACSATAVPSLVYGQVNHLVLLGLAVGVLAPAWGRERASGAGLGAAASVKAFPAVLGLWLLGRRAWRAVAAAVAVGLGVLAVGVAAFGVDAHADYLATATTRADGGTFAGGLDPGSPYVTLQRPLSQVLPGSPELLFPLAALLLAPPVAYLYTDLTSALDRDLAATGTVAAVVLVQPSLLLYPLFAFVPLLALLYRYDGPGRGLLTAGAALLPVAISLPGIESVATALPAWAADAVLWTARHLFLVGLPPLFGLLLVLAGCLRAKRASEDRRTRAPGES